MNIERSVLGSLLSIKITFIYIIYYDEYNYAWKVIKILKMSLMSFISKCVPKALTWGGRKRLSGFLFVSSIDINYLHKDGDFIQS